MKRKLNYIYSKHIYRRLRLIILSLRITLESHGLMASTLVLIVLEADYKVSILQVLYMH